MNSNTERRTGGYTFRGLDRDKTTKDGEKLFRLLLKEMGDADLLPKFAERFDFDLEKALADLRSQGVIEESDLGVRIKRWPVGGSGDNLTSV